MACKAESGLTVTCEDLLRVGGLGKTFWVGYLSELDTQISLTQAADITAIDFGSYGGFRRFDGTKFSHSAGYEIQRSASGTISYKHSVSVKLLNDSTADDVILQDLSLGQDIFILAEDNNRDFFIYGAGNGLTVESGTQNTGETGESDTRTSMVFSGQETTLPIRFSSPAGYQAALNYIESLEV